MQQTSILDLSLAELSTQLKPAFRAKQVYEWLYRKYADEFKEMSNLPKELQAELDERYFINPLKLLKCETSLDGSEKYLFELPDGKTVETVLLLMSEGELDEDGEVLKEPRYTVCISSQVGCKIGCAFCLTAKGGFERDLLASEIVSQLLYIKKSKNLPHEKKLNIVFMGMGEPLDNLENVAKAVQIFSEGAGFDITPKRQTISTSGLAPKITKLALMDLGVNLAISLHAVDNETREWLMPINKAYSIESIIEAVREFPADRRKKVLFEYLLIKGVNDDAKHADKLVKLLSGLRAKVNMILFNPYPDSPFERPSRNSAVEFQERLNRKGVICTIRQSRGLDISAACGQLRSQNLYL